MFARTKRLTLRPGWPEDAPAVFAAIAHRTVVEKLARVPWPYELHHARDWLSRPAGDDHAMLIEAHDLGPAPRLVGWSAASACTATTTATGSSSAIG